MIFTTNQKRVGVIEEVLLQGMLLEIGLKRMKANLTIHEIYEFG